MTFINQNNPKGGKQQLLECGRQPTEHALSTELTSCLSLRTCKMPIFKRQQWVEQPHTAHPLSKKQKGNLKRKITHITPFKCFLILDKDGLEQYLSDAFSPQPTPHIHTAFFFLECQKFNFCPSWKISVICRTREIISLFTQASRLTNG